MEAMYQDVISPAPKTDLGRNYINQQKKKGMIDPKKVKKGTYVADAAEANALINGILRGNFVRDPPIPVEQPDIEEGPDGEIEIEGEVRRNFVGAAPGEFRWFPQGVDILDAVARGPMEIHMDRFQEALRDRREQERAQENARQVADANAMRIRDLPADRVAAPRRRIRHPRGIIN
jgi:hypothetical protein